MNRPMSIHMTDALVERMLVERAGRGATDELVREIVAAVGATPQRRPGILPRLAWPPTPGTRSRWLIVGIALLVGLMIGAVLIGSLLLRRSTPLVSGPLIVYQVRGSFADVFTLDVISGERTALGSVQLTAPIGGQRIRWAADGRHALVFGDQDHLQAQVDLAGPAIAALDLLSLDGQQDEVSPAGDRVARLLGDAERGMSLSVVDLGGTELVHVPLPAGVVASSAIEWAPDGSSVLLSGCTPCDLKAIPSPTNHQHLFLVPLDGSPIRQLTDDTTGVFSDARFSPDGSTIAYSTVLCRDACTGGIATVSVADGRISRLTTSGPDAAPAWSPGGDRIAFQRAGSDGGIYVMSRDGNNLVRLTTASSADVDRDRAPIWSPDAAWIAFTRDLSEISLGDLWVVPSGGGEASLLERNAVADWGPPATLTAVVPSSPASVSASASAPPSAPVEASASAAPAESGAPSGPSPLGGGLLMVYQLDGTSSATATTASVFTVDIGTGQRTMLGTLPVTEATCCPQSVQWSADRQRALLSSLRLQAIVELRSGTIEPANPPPAGQFKEAISTRGDRIARVDEVSGAAKTIVIADLAGRELSRVSMPGVRYIAELTWSPDDGALAVITCGPCFGDPEPAITQLLVVGVDGPPAREVTSNAAEVAAAPASQPGVQWDRFWIGPAWSPDGRTIALAERACVFSLPDPLLETCTGRLLSVDVPTGRQTPLTDGEGAPGAPTWSPDGMRLAFGQAEGEGERLGLFVIDRDGQHLTLLADGNGPADWSPDGTWLEFVRINEDLPDGADKIEVWVVPAGGGEARLIAEHAAAGW